MISNCELLITQLAKFSEKYQLIEINFANYLIKIQLPLIKTNP